MVWPWSSTSSSAKPPDQFSHLSPEVREFLEREAPIKPSSFSTSTTSSEDAKQEREGAKAEKMKPPTTQYSKYGDKYADLWAQYKPPAQVAAELRTPSMAISDVYESYRARKAALGRAALENCALQQLDLHECYKTWSTIGGCTEPRHKLDDCFMTQQKLLKVLGYMSELGRDPETEEKIQMHADKLYQEQVRKVNELVARSKRGESLKDENSET